jgi:hypothetical protein
MNERRQSVAEAPLRPPETVMRLGRLGSFHQCRLSFMRTLLRRARRENWTFARPVFDIDKLGVGHAVYTAQGPERTYSLVCFGHDLPPDQRSDRVIAHAWDSTFALYDGVPGAADIERLSRNVPKQEAGRVSEREITLSRANRSVRLFEHVVDQLAEGRQPDREQIEAVGYIMRTTAVYGSGKFGAVDREAICGRPEFAAPFQPEMLTVYLIRAYTLDVVERMAQARAPRTAVRMDPHLRHFFGVGNSTGLGLAPFIVNHPALFNNWIGARETALARIRAKSSASMAEKKAFRNMLARAGLNTDLWRSVHELQIKKVAMLSADLARLQSFTDAGVLEREAPWDRLYRWGEGNLSLEGQEQLVSLLLEPHGDSVDDLADSMSADESAVFPIDGAMPLERLKEIVEDVYDYALALDWHESANNARVWYVSAEKLEPRLGERFQEPVEAYEQPLSPGRDAVRMHEDIVTWTGEGTVADFLLRHPEHRHIARRAQTTSRLPYAEIRDNTIAATMLPIDLLRCKLSFFGATHFDPRSDRWVRINMFKNAPFPDELNAAACDDWSYPPLAETDG